MVCTYFECRKDYLLPNGDMPSDDRVPLDEYDDHSYSAFTIPCAFDDLELYDVTSRPQE